MPEQLLGQPAVQNLQPTDLQREQEYRQKLVTEIVALSVGTVGMHVNMSLDNEASRHMNEAIEARNPGTRRSISGAGWNDYGERVVGNNEPLAIATWTTIKYPDKPAEEKLNFMEMPDGNFDVRYGFTSEGYLDYNNRPGNRMQMGFILPGTLAKQLRQTVQKDPSIIRDIIKAQALAIGLPQEDWQLHIEPRYGFRKEFIPKDPNIIVGTVVDGKVVEEEPVPFSRHESILPISSEAAPEVLSDDPIKDQILTETREWITREGESSSPTDWVDKLATELVFYENMVFDSAGDAARLRRGQSGREAIAVVYEEYIEAHEVNPNSPHDFAIQCMRSSFQNFVDEALRSGIKEEEVKPPGVMRTEVGSELFDAGVKFELIEQYLETHGVSLKPEDLNRLLVDVKKARAQVH